MLAIWILVVVIASSGIIYGLARHRASSDKMKKELQIERRQKEQVEKKKHDKLQTERMMHQEEALTMAKNNPQIVARVVKNWLS